MRAMTPGAVRAICFDLDNTLWDIEPVLIARGTHSRRLARTPIPDASRSASRRRRCLQVRAALLRDEPHQAHDLSHLRRETIARLAEAVGYDRDMAHEAFALWHAARNRLEPYAEVVPALERLETRFRLATLSNGNADLSRHRARAPF